MLSAIVVNRIQRMLATGEFTQRQIAKEVGVSESAVSRLALGERAGSVYAKRREEAPKKSVGLFQGALIRCPECGSKVYAESLRPSGLCIACDNARKTPEEIAKLAADEHENERYQAMFAHGPKDGPQLHGLATPIKRLPPTEHKGA
jgi:transcriptional regulator with XRE-family HTH domain